MAFLAHVFVGRERFPPYFVSPLLRFKEKKKTPNKKKKTNSLGFRTGLITNGMFL